MVIRTVGHIAVLRMVVIQVLIHPARHIKAAVPLTLAAGNMEA